MPHTDLTDTPYFYQVFVDPDFEIRRDLSKAIDECHISSETPPPLDGVSLISKAVPHGRPNPANTVKWLIGRLIPDNFYYSYTFTVSTRNNTFEFSQGVLRAIVGNDAFYSMFYSGYSVRGANRLHYKYYWNNMSVKSQYHFLNIWLGIKLKQLGLSHYSFVETSDCGLLTHSHSVVWLEGATSHLATVIAALHDINKSVNKFYNLDAMRDCIKKIPSTPLFPNSDLEAWLTYICKDYWYFCPLITNKFFYNI